MSICAFVNPKVTSNYVASIAKRYGLPAGKITADNFHVKDRAGGFLLAVNTSSGAEFYADLSRWHRDTTGGTLQGDT